MKYDPARPDGTNDTASAPVSPNGRAPYAATLGIPAREGRALVLERGERLHVVNRSGTQVCDFFALVEAPTSSPSAPCPATSSAS